MVLAAGLLWGTVGPAEILARPAAGPVAVGGARILSGGLVLAVIMLVRDPGAFRALPRAAWPALLAASAATATFQGTFLTAAARSGAAVATAVTFGIAPVSTGLCERIMLGTRLPRRWIAGTACAIAGCVLISAPHGAGPAGQAHVDVYGIACGVVAGGCFGVYTVSAKRLIHDNVNMQAAVPVTLLLGGAVLAPWTIVGAARTGRTALAWPDRVARPGHGRLGLLAVRNRAARPHRRDRRYPLAGRTARSDRAGHRDPARAPVAAHRRGNAAATRRPHPRLGPFRGQLA